MQVIVYPYSYHKKTWYCKYKHLQYQAQYLYQIELLKTVLVDLAGKQLLLVYRFQNFCTTLN